MLSNAGIASVVFSGLLTIAIVSGLIVAAVKYKGDQHAFNRFLLGEHGLKALIPAAFGVVAGGVMIAYSSQPIAIIIAAAISFGIHAITDIIYLSRKIHETVKERNDLKAQLDETTDSTEKESLEKHIAQLNKKLGMESQRLGISVGSLIVATSAFTLLGLGATALAAGAAVLGPTLLGAAGVILAVLSIFSITMMSIGIHKKRMAKKKRLALDNTPEEPSVSAATPKAEEGKPASPLKRAHSYCPSQRATGQIAGFSHAYEANRPRSQSENTPSDSPKTKSEKKAIKQGIVGMAKAARKHASEQVHGDTLKLEPKTVIPKPSSFNATSSERPRALSAPISEADIQSAWAHKQFVRPRSFTAPMEAGSQWSSASSVHALKLTLTLKPTPTE